MNEQSFISSFWQKNVEALERRDPNLALRVREALLTNRFVIARTEDGSPALGVVMQNGQTAALCDARYPMQEAERWVSGLNDEMKVGGHVLLVGFGSGFHALAYDRLSDADTLLWIVEPDLELFKAALHVMDFRPLIDSPRIQFSIGLPETETARLLFTGPGGARMRARGIQVALTSVSRHLYAEYVQRLGAAIQEAIQMEGLKFRTSEVQGEVIPRNVLNNLQYVLQGAPWKRLIGKAPGVPALVIAPGPSLEDAIPPLKEIRDRAIFIAVDTAHRILHHNGIESDAVVSLDFTKLNARHFETVQRDQAMLLAFPGIDPSICKRYVGRTIFYDHSGSVKYEPGATLLLDRLHSLGKIGRLISYGSTAHIAVHAARMMGCSPIVLVGNDLAFPQSRWYSDGAMQNEIEQPEREGEPLLPVESNDGKTVFTSGLYKHYLTTFGELVRGIAAPVINTSPHGARIENCRWMDLQEALSKYCVDPVDVSFLENALNPSLRAHGSNLIAELDGLAQSINRVRRLLLRLSERQASISPFSSQFRGETVRLMKDFSNLIRKESGIFDLCMGLCSRSTLTLLGGAGQSSLFGGKDAASNQKAHERCSNFFNDMNKALQLYQQLIAQTKDGFINPLF